MFVDFNLVFIISLMSILNLVIYPDPRLRRATLEVKKFDAPLKTLVADMIETMYHYKGVGLAAPQVGEALRLFVVDVSENRDQPQIYINPTFLEKNGQNVYEEGCLSVPSYYANVTRPATVRLRAQNLQGVWFEQDTDGLLATCVQHEHDHLEGALFIDYLSKLKKNRAEKKVAKWKMDRLDELLERSEQI